MSSNHKILLVVSGFFFLLAAMAGAAVVSEVGVVKTLLMVLPFLLMSALPAFYVWYRHRSKRGGKRSPFVMTQHAPATHFSEVEIRESEQLPSLCVLCGTKTNRTTLIQQASAEDGVNKYDWSRVNPLLALFLLWKFTLVLVGTFLWTKIESLFGKARNHGRGFRIRVPQCPACSKRYPIYIRHLDFHGKTAILYATSAFVEASRISSSQTGGQKGGNG